MSPTPPERIAADEAACLAQLREQDRDAYYALLFMPVRHRPALVAFHAYAAELAAIRSRVSEPLPGEVRVQWWRDVLAGEGERGGEGHPVAASLMRAVNQYSLPITALDAMAEAMIGELYDDPWPDVTAMEAHFGAVDSALLRLCALVVAEGVEAGPADAPGHAGVALGVTRLLRQFALRATRGQCVLPADVMARHGVSHEALMTGKAEPGLKPALAEMIGLARGHLTKARGFIAASPANVRPAFRQTVLCEGYLRLIEPADHDPFRDRVERAPLAILWTLWRGGVPLG
jgi:phytoene synthase